jgi:hypothetical protein
MDTDLLKSRKYVTAFGHAYYRDGDDLGCAPLLAEGGVDWEGSTIVEECPEAEKEQIQRVLHRLKFDATATARIIAGIGWY